MAKGKDFSRDIAEMGGISALIEQTAQASAPSPTPAITHGDSHVKKQLGCTVDERDTDQIRDFIIYQRTVNMKPHYSQKEAILDGLKMLYEKEGFTKHS